MPKVQDIAPAKYNPRKISKVQLEALGRSMREFGDLGGLVGSGATLIAAEHGGRKCFGMELSPAYCDVIIARWEKATGQKAVKC